MTFKHCAVIFFSRKFRLFQFGSGNKTIVIGIKYGGVVLAVFSLEIAVVV